MSKVRKRKPVRWKRMSVFDLQPSFSTQFLDHKIYIHGKSEHFSSTIVKLLISQALSYISPKKLWVSFTFTLNQYVNYFSCYVCNRINGRKRKCIFQPSLFSEHLWKFFNWNHDRNLMEVLVNVQRPEVRSENLFHGYLYIIIIHIFLRMCTVTQENEC